MGQHPTLYCFLMILHRCSNIYHICCFFSPYSTEFENWRKEISERSLGGCNFSWVALDVGGDSAESQDAIPFWLSLSHDEMQNRWKWTNGRIQVSKIMHLLHNLVRDLIVATAPSGWLAASVDKYLLFRVDPPNPPTLHSQPYFLYFSVFVFLY